MHTLPYFSQQIATDEQKNVTKRATKKADAQS